MTLAAVVNKEKILVIRVTLAISWALRLLEREEILNILSCGFHVQKPFYFPVLELVPVQEFLYDLNVFVHILGVAFTS